MRRRHDDRRPAHRFAVALVSLVAASACGAPTAPTADGAEVPPTTAPAVARAVGGADAVDGRNADLVVVADLVMEDVVAAALLIASGGDLEAAIAAGLVGEIEAEAALDALERGSLDGILGGTGGVD